MSDSARSPMGAITATTIPSRSAFEKPKGSPSKGPTSNTASSTPTPTVAKVPPNKPSMVLFGLTSVRGEPVSYTHLTLPTN